MGRSDRKSKKEHKSIESNRKQSESKGANKEEHESFKERHQRLFIFSPDMYEKLLEHRETIERRIAVINKQSKQHGDSDGEGGRDDGGIDEIGQRRNTYGENLDIHSGRDDVVRLCFDNSRYSVIIDADEEDQISKAKRELCQLFPTIPSTSETEILPSSTTNKPTDELGLSDLLPSLLLESDVKSGVNDEDRMLNSIGRDIGGSGSRVLTYAASWDVSTNPMSSEASNVDARRCHSSYNVMPSHPALGLRNQALTPSSMPQQQKHRSLFENHHPLTNPAANMLLISPLPPELCISSELSSAKSVSVNPIYSTTGSNKTEKDVNGVPNIESQQHLIWGQHTQLNRTQSDNATKCFINDRRKLESEDSSYDSDHADHECLQGQSAIKSSLTASIAELANPAIANWTTLSTTDCGSKIWRNSMKQPLAHDDVSRSTSETLAAEFADYVTLNSTVVSTVSSSKQAASVPQRNTNQEVVANNIETSGIHSSTPFVDIVQNEDYNNKLMFALKLGFNEELLKKALTKLGTNAERDKLTSELIRLQKITAATEESQLEKASNNHINDDEISHKSNEAPSIELGGRMSNEGISSDDTIGVRRAKGTSLTKAPSSDDDAFFPVVIDGSNVAMSHGNKDRFSCKGIAIAVEFFRKRGHKSISVFVPKWRKESSKPESPITDQHILLELEKNGNLFFTPSRQAMGKRIVCHDDRYILNLAAETDGVVVSNDNYRELIMDKPEYRKIIEERILMYSFVNDRFMPPDDPLGRNGPTLEAFLRRKSSGPISLAASGPSANSSLARNATVSITPCPYGKKCTYGNKCKFYHAERGNQPQKSVTDKLKENSTQKINEIKARGLGGDKTAESSRDSSPGDQLLRTQSVGRQFYASSQEQLYQKNSVSEFDAINKQHISKTLSSNPRIDCGLLESSSLWPSNIDHQRIPCAQKQPWNHVKPSNHILGQPLPLDTSLPPPPPRTPWTMPDNIPSDQTKQLDSVLENNSHRKLARQLTLNPTYDPRIPRSYQQLPQSDVHAMNMPPPLPNGSNLDSKHQAAGFPYPPPNYHTQKGTPSNHMMLSRNASAPEPKHHHQQPYKISLYGTQSTHGREFETYSKNSSQGASNQPLHAHGQYKVHQQHHLENHLIAPRPCASQANQQSEIMSKQMIHPPMHKTMSDSFVWSSNLVEGGNAQGGDSVQQKLVNTGVGADQYHSSEGVISQRIPSTSLHNTSSAVSPLIGVSSVPGVWETNDRVIHEVKRNLGPIGSKPLNERTQEVLESERIRIYNHLTALFPKDQAMCVQAMNAMPEERNPEQICKYLLFLKNNQQH